MATLVITKLPPGGHWQESEADRLTQLATALRDHFPDVPVSTRHVWPAARIRVPVPRTDLESAAALYCDGAGIEFHVVDDSIFPWSLP